MRVQGAAFFDGVSGWPLVPIRLPWRAITRAPATPKILPLRMAATDVNLRTLLSRSWPIFLLLAFILIVMVRSSQKYDRIRKANVRTKAVITDVRHQNEVYVAYVLNGRTHRGREIGISVRDWLRRWNGAVKPGDSVMVIYDAADPDAFLIDMESYPLNQNQTPMARRGDSIMLIDDAAGLDVILIDRDSLYHLNQNQTP